MARALEELLIPRAFDLTTFPDHEGYQQLVIERGIQFRSLNQVAEAFARAWLSWREVRRHPAPRAWVVRTALNVGVSWWRRRIRELPLAGQDAAAPRDVDDGLDAALLTALRHLPDRQREVIALRVFLDLDIDTIAGHLGIAPATVRVHLSRAVTTLRHELSPSQAVEVD